MGFKFGDLTREITETGAQIANTCTKVIEKAPSLGNEIVHTASKVGDSVSATGGHVGNAISDGIKKLPDAGLDEKLNSKSINTLAASVGDVVFPDNPKLRQRVEQLDADCRLSEAQFNRTKKDFERLEYRSRVAIAKYLKTRGFDSLESLDREVRRVATGKVFEEWGRLKTKIGRDLAIENMIETICGIAALGGVTVTGSLVTVGMISGPAGWSVLGAIGTASATIGGVVFVGALIKAMEQEDELKHHIKQLYYARSDLRLNLNRLNVLVDWSIAFAACLDMIDDTSFSSFESLLAQLEKRDRWRWMPSEVTKELAAYDRMRQAWTKADPEAKY
ncbi:uncharacterized protein B0T15DRAFT_499248 [Chaetomium strumarium]|uniref:Uncharacterized protein n=1 Tax=Chaetomium strumarium TaxID=1170767 RepID=A0AAJ0H3P8_9PEZI|nr:hypothetical protein B0T15DRAFT_499248 [Chaetomium strumarium]